MRPEGPAFWLLNGPTGWRTAHVEGVSVGQAGIRLAAAPAGPLALTSPDGALGRLVLPRGMALDAEEILYLLAPNEPRITRFDPETRAFVQLPEVGGEGHEARQFHQPANIAVAGHDLYVADLGNRRVQVFDVRSLALRYVWGPWDRWRRPADPGDPRTWEPVDVTSQAGAAYILDRRYGRVYRHQPGRDRLELIVDEPDAAGRWSRLAVDRTGCIYLLDTAHPRLEIYDPRGQQIGEVHNATEVRDRFDPPAVVLDHQERFCLPAGLLHHCNRQVPDRWPPDQAPLQFCPPWTSEGLVFDRWGRETTVDPTEPPGPAPFGAAGTWISEALDSERYDCQWHRLVLELSSLPAGSRVVVRTYTDANPLPIDQILALADHHWQTDFAITGPMQPPGKGSGQATDPHELLVQSRTGQHLWLQLVLEADGYDSPSVASVEVHYPRESYLQYLPAVYSTDDESRWFLERFLSIFQTEWDGLEQQIDDIARYFDPKSVPDGDALEYLAAWLALPLEGDWNDEEMRRLLMAAPGITPRRGMVEGLRDYLRIYLQNITGLDFAGQRGFPQIVEGFQVRQYLMLNQENHADLGTGAPLWGPAMIGRLQLDVYAREGEVRLVSTGDPERDIFHHYAHQFRVFVPAAWVRTADDERMLQRALDAEKPAHTSYDLCLVEPRLRVGIQSTVGIDTIIGDLPVARLTCAEEEEEAPPSRWPRNRLGYDTILAGSPDGPSGLSLVPGTRVGLDTILK